MAAAVDVTDDDAVARATEHVVSIYGRIDGLVNCVGTLDTAARLADQPLDRARTTFEINTHAVLSTMQQVLPPHGRGGDGAPFVNVASTAAMGARPGLSPYSASKSATLA